MAFVQTRPITMLSGSVKYEGLEPALQFLGRRNPRRKIVEKIRKCFLARPTFGARSLTL